MSQDEKEICKDQSWRHQLHQVRDQCIGNGGHVFLTQSPKRKWRSHYLLTKESLQPSDHQAANIIRTTNEILWNEHVRLSHAQGCKVPLIHVNNARDKGWSALTTSVTDLNTSLTDMKRDNFTHCELKIDDYKGWMTSGEETWRSGGQGLWQQNLLSGRDVWLQPQKDINSRFRLQWRLCNYLTHRHTHSRLKKIGKSIQGAADRLSCR